ncbi:MAG: hypothetical protein H7840_12155 [Alphaproteobacteria bacterium]
MKVLAVLPPDDAIVNDLVRGIRVIEKRFGAETLTLAAEEDDHARYADIAGGRRLEKYVSGWTERGFNVIVYMLGLTPRMFKGASSAQRVYLFQTTSVIHPGRGPFILKHPEKYDEIEHPHIETHIFNRLSSRSWGFVNFPYGNLYMDPELGPVDSMGFRIAIDWRALADRDPDHKVVAIFGGSAAFSCLCMFDEMFATRLQERLDADRRRFRYTVLNFGMHDHVVIQEMMAYLLHASSVTPDIVLSHGGHNDCWYGLQDDTYLVSHCNLIYPRHAEEWSKFIHDTKNIATPPQFSCAVGETRNNIPQKVFKAYVTRKRQFKHMVESNGGTFLWGHQPVIWNRSHMTEWEKYIAQRNSGPFMRRLRTMMSRASDDLAAMQGLRLIDFTRVFAALGDDDDYMWDHVHASPAGDEVIARVYGDAILALEDGRWTEPTPWM